MQDKCFTSYTIISLAYRHLNMSIFKSEIWQVQDGRGKAKCLLAFNNAVAHWNYPLLVTGVAPGGAWGFLYSARF